MSTVVSIGPQCPLDGSSVHYEESVDYMVCDECREMLADDELVARANRRTQRDYLAANYPDGYDRPLKRFSLLRRIIR